MRPGAYFMSGILMILLGALHVQPLFLHYEIKKEPVCAKTKCQKQQPVQEKEKQSEKDKKDCANQGCNPFVPCAMGSCCYVVESFFAGSPMPIIKKQKRALLNDMTLLNTVSECWHPPEMIS
jgi:hypothetical protein